MNEQKALLQALWRKAARMEEPLRIPCGSPGEATRLRFALYNAVKDIRKPKEGFTPEPELQAAVQNCSVSFDPEDKKVLLLQRQVVTGMMATLKGLLGPEGMAEETLVGPESLSPEEESQRRLLEMLQEPEPEPAPARSTPYYTR